MSIQKQAADRNSENGDAPPLPDVPLPAPDRLPPEMLSAPWLAWRAEWQAKKAGWKLSKIPCDSNACNVGYNDPHTVTTFAHALERAKRLRQARGPHFGVGVSFSKPCDFWILDLDGELTKGGPTPRLRWLCENAPTWAEVSVSGHGLHCVFRGGWAINRKLSWRGQQAELLGAGKFVAITGTHWPESLATLGDAGPLRAELDALLAGSPADPPASANGRTAGKRATGGDSGDDRTKRAAAYLAKCDAAISGQGGHDTTMSAARAIVWGFDLGESTGFQLLADHYNPRCQPPWSEKELRHKCADAATKPCDKPRGWLLEDRTIRGAPALRVPTTKGKASAEMAADRPQAVIVRLDAVQAQPVDWLWEGRIPLGAVTLIEGDPNLGKSTLTADLAARVSRGWRMPPDGGPMPDLQPAGVLLLSAEDSLEQTIKPRLEAAGADTSRIVAFTAVRDSSGDERPPVLPYDLTELETTIMQHAARLVVVDPLMAYLDSEINAHRDQDVRHAMHRFKLLAERTGVALVVVRHLNKLGGGSAIYRGGGSIGIIGAARSALLVGRDPSDRSTCVIASVKSNLSRPPASLRYRLESATVNGVEVGRIGWMGECDLTADDLVARPEPPRAKSKAEQCADAIRELIGDGAIKSDELDQQLTAAGFSGNAIRDGKRLVKVKATREGFGPQAVYTLSLAVADGDAIAE